MDFNFKHRKDLKMGLTPKEAALAFCRQCVPSFKERQNCKGDKLLDGAVCPLYPYRTGKGRPKVKDIRNNCKQCMNGQWALIKNCVSQKCPLHSFRLGTNPNRSRSGANQINKGVNTPLNKLRGF